MEDKDKTQVDAYYGEEAPSEEFDLSFLDEEKKSEES